MRATRGAGPFGEADEHALLSKHGIEIVVAKNSGGEATYGKIAAARALGLQVVMLRRPTLPAAPAVETSRMRSRGSIMRWRPAPNAGV